MITQQELKELLDYNPETGIFTWKNASKRKAGTSMYSGYIRLNVNKKQYLAHRLIWLYVYGYFPKYVDHINMNRSDNRLCNLREATNTQNQYNKKLTKRNTSGIKGVSWFERDKNWRARLHVSGKLIHLGYFDSIEEAKKIITEYRNKLHGQFANHG